MALVEMSVVERWYRAVLAVERGESEMVVAAQFEVSHQTLYTWVTRRARDGLAWWIGRSDPSRVRIRRRTHARSSNASKMVHSGLVRPVNTFPFFLALARNQSVIGERTATCSEDQYSRRLAMSRPSKTRMATSLIRLRTFWVKSSNWASHSTMAVFPSR